MGQNPSGFCGNKGKCCAIAQTIHDENHPDPDAIDALEYGNPYISCNGYERGVDTYWEVAANKKLPPGYAVAENARLPWTVEDGLIEVVASDRGYAPAVRNPNFFLEIDSNPIVLIEWCDGKIRQIYTQAQQYWCNQRKDGCLLCSSDGGDEPIEHDYWIADDNFWPITLYGEPNRVELTSERLDSLKPWLENTITCEDQHYCVICQDSVYKDHYGSCECNHIHYIDWLSSWGGCGYGEEDFSEEYRISLRKIHPSARKRLRKLLEAKNIRGLWEFGNKLCGGDELDPTAAWIKSLDEDTPDAIAQTLIWLGGVA